MGRRNNFLSTNELIKIHKNSKTYDFEASLELFIEDCKLRNLRSHSISYYLSELKVFERYLLEQEISTAPDSITQEVIRRNVVLYRNFLKRAEEAGGNKKPFLI